MNQKRNDPNYQPKQRVCCFDKNDEPIRIWDTLCVWWTEKVVVTKKDWRVFFWEKDRNSFEFGDLEIIDRDYT